MNLDASTLQISVEEDERWRRRMSVTVPASVVQAEERKAAQQLASRARLKGFRKGKVPAKVIESRFGGSLRQEALDTLIGAAYREALALEELRPISEGEIENLDYQPEQDLTFSIAFDVEPTFDISRVSGFAVERVAPPVTDEQIDEVLGRIQEQNGVWQPLDEGTPKVKDLVSVKISKLDDDDELEDEGRDYDLVVGQGDAIPDIEQAIQTLQPGESGDFDIGFPDDFPDEDRRGDSERVRIELSSLRTMDLPDLDDDLASQVGDFETMDELKAKIREDMEEEARKQADAQVRGRLLDLIIEANHFDVPESMVRRYSDGLIGDQPNVPEEQLAQFREQIRPQSEQAVKRILVIERIAEVHGLAATDDDLDARIEEIAEANNTDAAKVYAQLQKSGRLEALERELTEKAVFDFLYEQSEITDVEGA
ncbi:MAG: trigger factor [Gemmatimonadetes bacterium]|nr:trigger factor [Gemmatimonadota bacterium]NNL30523.1 trigger factor [Gemmatimonadota bacterium]